MLVSALTAHALARGITRYTGVADLAWFRQIEQFGWRCRALGRPRSEGAAALTAMVIDIDETTPALLAAKGIGSLAGEVPSASIAHRAPEIHA